MSCKNRYFGSYRLTQTIFFCKNNKNKLAIENQLKVYYHRKAEAIGMIIIPIKQMKEIGSHGIRGCAAG